MNSEVKNKLENQQVEPHVHGPHCNHDHHLEPIKRETPKVGRNDPCHCGSEKKFKKCCGK